MKLESNRARIKREAAERDSRCGHYAAHPQEALDKLLDKHHKLTALMTSNQWLEMGESAQLLLEDIHHSIESTLAQLALGCVQMEDRATRYAKYAEQARIAI